MYNLKFGCQSYPWKMGKHFGQLPRMLKVAAEQDFRASSAKSTCLEHGSMTRRCERNSLRNITWNLRHLFFIRIGMAWRRQ